MKKYFSYVIFLLICVGAVYAAINPYPAYCAARGGQGEYGSKPCKFPDGTVCSQLDFYHGKCGQNYKNTICLEYNTTSNDCVKLEKVSCIPIGNMVGPMEGCCRPGVAYDNFDEHPIEICTSPAKMFFIHILFLEFPIQIRLLVYAIFIISAIILFRSLKAKRI